MGEEVGLLLFPNQLFTEIFLLPHDRLICLVEDTLFFKDTTRSTSFAKIKLCYTRATMKRFEARLKEHGFSNVHYISFSRVEDSGLELCISKHRNSFEHYDVMDYLLQAKLKRFKSVKLVRLSHNPAFLFNSEELATYKKAHPKNTFLQTSFYRHFRHQTGILMTRSGAYKGGKLSFDGENRARLPPGLKAPVTFDSSTENENLFIWKEALDYVKKQFDDHPGDLQAIEALIDGTLPEFFAIDHEGAERHLEKFVAERLEPFGPYQDSFKPFPEDKTLPTESELACGTLFHSCLSPYINSGLLSPQQVLDRVVYHEGNISSLEGFVRQILGWREFVRFVYQEKGEEMRASNQLCNDRVLDDRWYKGTLGVPPVDQAIQFGFRYGYLHHILRLMVVANFMNLSRVIPNDMYRWFMDFSLDAYDWVMIGNVYGMASFASSVMSTKPYICGSNYVLKMSNYKRGPWSDTWDGLYYRFLDANQDLFQKNARMPFMLANLRKMDDCKRNVLFSHADRFLATMSRLGKRKLLP